MKPSTASLALRLGLLLTAALLPVSSTLAQSPRDPEVIRLQREIAEARAMIAKWTQTLHALEWKLARAEAGPPGLRFPVEIERAMIGEGMKASGQLLLRPLSTPRGQSGNFKSPRD